jgi:hypothetical protein
MASILKVDTIQESTTGAGTSFPHIIYADNDTTSNTPVLSFIGDTNTGIGRSGADTLDFITNGASRFRIESTGQIKAVYESQVGTDYNTQLDNGYLCRAWVNFNGTGTVAIRASGNVSSITDNGTGLYTINFTTALPDSNYSFVGTCREPYINNNYGMFVSGDSEFTKTVSALRINTIYDNNSAVALVDSPDVSVLVFR